MKSAAFAGATLAVATTTAIAAAPKNFLNIFICISPKTHIRYAPRCIETCENKCFGGAPLSCGK
jgi:hypothetical protein